MLDYLTIEKTTASATYGKIESGSLIIKRGSLKTRLCFPKLSSLDFIDENVNHVYVEVINKSTCSNLKKNLLQLASSKFIPLIYQDEIIYININSLSKRLGIEKEAILECRNNQDDLEDLIESALNRYQKIQNRVDNLYKKVVSEHYICDEYRLITKDGQFVERAKLHHYIGLAFFMGLINSQRTPNKILQLGTNHSLHVDYLPEYEDPILTLFTNTTLGSGEFGRVSIVKELTLGRFSAAKLTKDSNDDLYLNELKILKEINPENKLIGIQKTPYRKFKYTTNFLFHKQYYTGYIAPLYDTNLYLAIDRLNHDEILSCIRQLLRGLYELHKKQICHGDIKMENILIKRSTDEPIECVLADFGGAGEINERHTQPLVINLALIPIRDQIKQKLIKINGYIFKDKNANQKLQDLSFKEDIYAMGFVLKKLIKYMRFYSQENRQRLLELKDQMLQFPYTKRITALKARILFNRIYPVKERNTT